MNNQELDELWDANIEVFADMATDSGTLVKTVLLCAERNGPVYVALYKLDDQHATYLLKEGDEAILKKCAKALGALCENGLIGAKA